MAHLSFTKKVADKLKIDTKNVVSVADNIEETDDWVIDTVWNVKRDPWIMFYHKPSTFAVIIHPEKYKLDKCIDLFLMLIQELLIKHNLQDKMPYFMNLFKTVKICKNNDRSSTAYMTQNKVSVYWELENPAIEHKVSHLYDLMIYVNDIIRKKFEFNKTSLEAFLEMVAKIPIEITLH